MIPIRPSSMSCQTVVTKSLPMMPGDLLRIITDYTATKDYQRHIVGPIRFNKSGQVSNPLVREAYKEVFITSYCSAVLKTQLLHRLFSQSTPRVNHLLQEEGRKIFDEIATAGHYAQLDGVDLESLELRDINWQGIRLAGANLRKTVLTNINMTEAVLTHLTLEGGEWSNVNLARSDLSGTNLHHLSGLHLANLTDAVGLNPWSTVQLPIPPCPPSPQANKAVAEVLVSLPSDVIGIITQYLGETDYTSLFGKIGLLEDDGVVINARVRECFKEAFMSSYCSAHIKSKLMGILFANPFFAGSLQRDLLEREGRYIFNEIAESGSQVMFDNVVLRNMKLESINWSGIRLNGAHFINTRLIKITMCHAQARGMVVEGGDWIDVNLEQADLTAADLHRLRLMARANLNNLVGQPAGLPTRF